MSDTPYRYRKRFLDCSKLTLEEAEQIGHHLAELQRDVNFHIGDLTRYCAARWPDTWHQIWPEWMSPGLIQRTAAVCKAYPHEKWREAEATYTIYMQNASAPDRLELIASHVEAGHTSDEARTATRQESSSRWLLAVDVSYTLHKWWHSGAGVEAAMSVSNWIERTITRIQRDFPKTPLTDLICCFDGANNHRKLLTEGWDDQYKGNRGPKDPELGQQLNLVRELLDGKGFCCASIEGMEGDDIMASCAARFPGRVTLLTQDKDVRQCLNDRCNILLDVEWKEDEETGEVAPIYKWVSAKSHTEEKGLTPEQFLEAQILMGDSVDGIKGAEGIGQKGAADLIIEFGSARAAVEAALADDNRIKEKKRAALIAFEPKLETTRKLVTLRTDCQIPGNTRI